MARTPSSKLHTPHSRSNQTLTRTPQLKHRLNFGARENSAAELPVEVIGRMRDNPDSDSVLQINPDRNSVRVKTDIGYRDFTLDGVSSSVDDDLESFYKKFIETRITGVKLGAKCTIMMYGPTGSGKSYTMFGCVKQPGIVYRSLKGILGENEDVGSFVHVTVLEIYNEELYDLLSTNNGGGFGFGWPKSNSSKTRLEVMGKKAKNATFISGTDAGKISKEIQKVEKRRIIKNTHCNERSSRSHCMIILDVPTVGGRLMLVDMAGSENIEQAGQIGFEAKIQTCKINQGNIALKRVVESIANGDSHVPFRDSKLTMLLQDSFEDDKSKILMILCASPDSKEMHKTISTFEYGAKAKCIVRGPTTPVKDRHGNEETFLAMNQFVLKLQMENKLKERERNEAQKELMKKEEEISTLRTKLAQVEMKEPGTSEEEINKKVNERTQMLKQELEKKIVESEKMAREFVELEKRKMEERIVQQKQEVEMLRRRLEETELELKRSRERSGEDYKLNEIDANGFANRLIQMYADEDPGMIMSMDLDRSMDFDKPISANIVESNFNMNEVDHDSLSPMFAPRVPLSTVFEEEEDNDEVDKENSGDEEVQKEVVEEKIKYSLSSQDFNVQNLDYLSDQLGSETSDDTKTTKNTDFNRQTRIENIFTLCGNYHEIPNHNTTPGKNLEDDTEYSSDIYEPVDLKENYEPLSQVVSSDDEVEIHVQWEVSEEQAGKKFNTKFKVVKDATLADLRKLIEINLGADKQEFSFFALGDPTGAPVLKEKEATTPASLCPLVKGNQQHLNQLSFTPLQNILNVTAAR